MTATETVIYLIFTKENILNFILKQRQKKVECVLYV